MSSHVGAWMFPELYAQHQKKVCALCDPSFNTKHTLVDTPPDPKEYLHEFNKRQYRVTEQLPLKRD